MESPVRLASSPTFIPSGSTEAVTVRVRKSIMRETTTSRYVRIKGGESAAMTNPVVFVGLTTRTATASDAHALSDLAARLFEETYRAANTAEDMEAFLTSTFAPEIQAREL